ncbi:hypothetical protein AZH53_04300 [Methanomicrobiaceae archaeon CYW5]|nr:hypothetical protein [Methanovulcanius yangii]
MGNRSRVLGKILVLALALMAILVLSFVVVMGYQMARMEAESYNSVYGYEMMISTTEPIENVVLLLPVPAYYNETTGRNETVLNLSMVSCTNIDPEQVTLTIDDVGGVPMLNISADRIEPLYKNRIEPIPIMPGQNESELPEPTHIYSNRSSEETPLLLAMEMHMYLSGVDHDIDTRSPLGTEPLFMPYTVLGTITADTGILTEEGYYLSEGSTGYFVEVPFVLSYDAAGANVLSISCLFEGRNEWWVLGWQGNSYRERLSLEHTGPAEGTYPVRGVIITGDGVY